MKRLSMFAAALVFLGVGILAAFHQESFSPLRGEYMGLEATDVAEIFLPGKISTGLDEGCSIFYPGTRAFLWRTNRTGRDGLFLLEDRDGRWQPPEPLRFFEDDSLVWDFNLSPDGRWIYFTSDKKVKGMGKSNIWRARFEVGEWRRATVLGPEVNSEVNDSYPSLTLGGRYLFLSPVCGRSIQLQSLLCFCQTRFFPARRETGCSPQHFLSRLRSVCSGRRELLDFFVAAAGRIRRRRPLYLLSK